MDKKDIKAKIERIDTEISNLCDQWAEKCRERFLHKRPK